MHKIRKLHVLYQNAQNEECNPFMIISTPFEQFKLYPLSELPETTSGSISGVISLKLQNCHSNPSNPYNMSRAYFQCNSLIMHTYCALHYAMVDCCFSLSGVMFSPIERDPKRRSTTPIDKYLILTDKSRVYS